MILSNALYLHKNYKPKNKKELETMAFCEAIVNVLIGESQLLSQQSTPGGVFNYLDIIAPSEKRTISTQYFVEHNKIFDSKGKLLRK